MSRTRLRPLSAESVGSPIDVSLRKKVAVVGGGSAGIAALWALNRSHHDVYIYEASSKLGGHTNTVKWRQGKYETSVDAGFIFFNPETYPNFTQYLDRAKIDTVKPKWNFSISRDRGLIEWASAGWESLLSQKWSALSPRMWRMAFDVVRFNQFAVDVIMAHGDDNADFDSGVNGVRYKNARVTPTIGDYLEQQGYSAAFRDDYLVPLVAALWSIGNGQDILNYPAATLIQFMWNNRLLSTATTATINWMTLKDCSRSYIDAIMRGFPSNHLFLNSMVTHVSNEADGRVRVHLQDGKSEAYDHVILATHGDDACQILGSSATIEEKAILCSFRTSETTVVLHSDPALMPVSRKAWTARNHLTESIPTHGQRSPYGNQHHSIDRVSVTYDMNILQQIPRSTFGNIFVTVNPLRPPLPAQTQAKFVYKQPLFNTEAARARKALGRIQNKRNISFAGAWTGYGTHEDGFTSGLKVARDHLKAKLPFQLVEPETYRRPPTLGIWDLLLRLAILFVDAFIVRLLVRLMSNVDEIIGPKINGIQKVVMNGQLRKGHIENGHAKKSKTNVI